MKTNCGKRGAKCWKRGDKLTKYQSYGLKGGGVVHARNKAAVDNSKG